MDFMNLAKERYSVRMFSSQQVEDTKVKAILEAGQLSPTACNYQPQHYYVIQSKEALKKLEDCTNYTFSAPMAILICYDKNESWKRPYDGQSSGETDASIATTHMLLAIHEMGLGSTWVGFFDPCAIRKAYNIPEYLIPHSLLPIGYPANEAKPAHLHSKRKPIAEVTEYI